MYIKDDEEDEAEEEGAAKYLVDVKPASGFKSGTGGKHASSQIDAETGADDSSSKKQYQTHAQRVQARLAATTDEESSGTK